MELKHIALDRLSVSKLNMRAGKKPPDISDILPSVKKRGVIVPLLVRAGGNADNFEIVAGRRRYFAAIAAYEGQEAIASLPCGILSESDDVAALEASLIENFVRVDPDEVTKWETFAALVKRGRSADDIADTFGLTPSTVKRILALGNLLPKIREAYRSEAIDAATVRHLTLAAKAQQKTWLALFESEDGYAPRGSQLKAWLFGGSAIPVSAALFDVADYQGQIVHDLFEENGYFADTDAFWTAQSAEIARREARYLKEGWSSVEIIPPERHYASWDYVHTAKRKGGRVYVDVRASGEVVFHEGYLPLKEARRSVSADGSAEHPVKPTRPELTAPLQDYIDRHRHAAVRAKLAANTPLALRVMVAHAICGSYLWRVQPADCRSRQETTTQSIAASMAETELAERRRHLLDLLGFGSDEPSIIGGSDPWTGIEDVLDRLLALSDAEVMDILAMVMAESLAPATRLIGYLGEYLAIDMADYWQADSAFFGLLRDREVLTALLAEVGTQSLAEVHAKEKLAVIKALIADCIEGKNNRLAQVHWVPRWMHFPPSSYTERGGAYEEAAVQPPETDDQIDDQSVTQDTEGQEAEVALAA